MPRLPTMHEIPKPIPFSPVHPHPVADLAPRPARRLALLTSVLVYLSLGLLAWKGPAFFPAPSAGDVAPSKSVALLIIDENAPPHTVLPLLPQPEGGDGGGGDAARLLPEQPSEAPVPQSSPDDIDEVPSTLPTQATSPALFREGGGTGTGRSAGSGGGSGGGVGGGVGAGVGPGKQAVVLSIEDLDIESYEKPEYPRIAELGGIEGVVKVRLLVDESGVPIKVWAIEGSPLFIPSAIKSLQKWRFGALRRKRIPAPAEVEFLVRYVLDRPVRR